jgi:hypothetical protein
MSTTFIILTLAALLFLYYKKRSGNSSTENKGGAFVSPQESHLQTLINSGKYWGIYIDYKNEALCCPSVLELNKKQFPINSVPALPLEGCSMSKCQCKHAGLVEKRTLHKNGQQRRKSHDRRDAIRFEETADRRSHVDRRSDTWFHHDE